MDALMWERDRPHLRAPILVAAFAGWNDAAGAATTALQAAANDLDSQLIASIDPENFFDFQVNRPSISLSDGQARRVDWPQNELVGIKARGAERDLVIMIGTEPNLRWRTFATNVLDAAHALGVEMMVTLGALIADVAHSRPTPITGLASDPEMVERLGLSRSNYEGPTGIVGVLHDQCRDRGIASASLWAAVPHYVAAVPNPKAALALLRRLEGLTGVAVEASELEDAKGRFDEQVDRAVESNPEIQDLVQRLEEDQEQAIDGGPEDVPSGDSIAQDFQRFLRQRGTEPGPS